MRSDEDNPERIEREIEQDRNALRRTLNDLQDELSLDGLTRRVTDQLRENGGEWANSISHAARANPVALAVTGVGLAWLIFGRGYDPVHQLGAAHGGRQNHGDGRNPSVRSSGGPVFSAGSIASGSRSGAASDASWHGASASGSTEVHRHSGDDKSMTERMGEKLHDWRDRAAETGSSLGDGLRRTAHDVGDSVSRTTGSMYDRLSEGTDDLSEEARRRVTDARRRAIEARDAASDRLRQGRRAVTDGYDAEPLAFGAAAFAIGAGLACLLPRTRQEDELMGGYSDQLFAEAEAIFNEEKAKVQAAVSAGLDEAKAAAGNVAEAAREELKEDGGKTASGSSGPASGSSGMGSGTSGTGSGSAGTTSGGAGLKSGSLGTGSGSGSAGLSPAPKPGGSRTDGL